MAKSKDIGAAIGIGVIFISLLTGIVGTELVKHDIFKNGTLIKHVYLKSVHKQYRVNSYSYECVFSLNAKEITLNGFSRARSNIQKNAREFVSHSFPGVYSERFNRMQLLMLPEDFAKYGLPYPDSLRWVDSLNRSR